MPLEFNYRKWALEVAASCLNSDANSGLVVADDTPDPAQAREAFMEVVRDLELDAKRLPGRTE